MTELEKREMTWQERQANVAHVMTVLDGIDTKSDDRTTELLSLLQMTAQLLAPGIAVKITYG